MKAKAHRVGSNTKNTTSTALSGQEPVGIAAPIRRPWNTTQATSDTITQKTILVTGAVTPTRLVSDLT
jgi:hypothetical protein